MEYVTKQITIEAFQYKGYLFDKESNYTVPKWFVRALVDGMANYVVKGEAASDLFILEEDGHKDGSLYITTSRGIEKVRVGDYVIREMDGKFHSCNPDMFDEKYEKRA